MAQINDLLVLGNSNLLGSANIMGTLTNNGKKISPDDEIVPLIVTVTADNNNTITSLSHTTAEMRAAVNDGRLVLCKFNGYTTMWGTKVAITVFGYYSWNEYLSDGQYSFYFVAWQGDAKYYINITDTSGRCTLNLLTDYINPNNYNTFKINTTTTPNGGSGSSGSGGIRNYTTITPDSAEATLTINLDGIEAIATDTDNMVLLKPMAGTGITVDQLGIHHYRPSNSTINDLVANGRKYVTGLTFDSFGHVIGYTTGTETITAPSNMTGATASAAGKAGLVPAPAAGKQATYLRGDATWAALPTASTSAAGIVKIGSNISVSSGTISVPAASDATAGVTIVYPKAKCTTYTSDSGTVTPAAVKQAVEIFGITKADGGTFDSGASTQKDQPQLKWATVNSKTPFIGYATDQTDGTFVMASITGTTYQTGLAIGGGSGNLLWKGVRVATTSDIPSTHAASKITAGTFAGQVVAKSDAQTPGTSLLRNSQLVSTATNPTVNGEICWQYE